VDEGEALLVVVGHNLPDLVECHLQ